MGRDPNDKTPFARGGGGETSEKKIGGCLSKETRVHGLTIGKRGQVGSGKTYWGKKARRNEGNGKTYHRRNPKTPNVWGPDVLNKTKGGQQEHWGRSSGAPLRRDPESVTS